MGKVQKAIEISDAKIQFVSLVDKAANKRQFLITKAENGRAQFSTYGKLLKVDDSTHYITGIVYEPLVEDAHGNFMTEEEIRKAAYWYAKNGDEVDIQHSFDAVDGVTVVENYLAPCDMEIEGELVVKGTWIMTVEVNNAEIWSAVQKGEITGLSMGGVGKYSEEDVELDNVSKQAAPAAPADAPDKVEKQGLLRRLAKALGLDPIEKGEVLDRYNESTRSSAFWNAMWALEDVLYRYDWSGDRYVFTSDPDTVREALSDFSTIVTNILTGEPEAIVKAVALPVSKAGKKMSSANKKKLDDICQALSDFKSSFDEDEEGDTIEKEENTEMTNTEITALVEETVKKSLEAAGVVAKDADPAPAAPAAEPAQQAAEPESTPDIEATVEKAVQKALVACGLIDEEPAEEQPVTKATLEEVVSETVNKALEPLLKARGIASNLNDTKPVEKSGPHYLAGIL